MIFGKHTHQDMSTLIIWEKPKLRNSNASIVITFANNPPTLTFNAILKVTFFSTKIKHNLSYDHSVHTLKSNIYQ